MSPVLPFDIFSLIIDIAGENEDTDLLKVLALVSHSFLQICSKHLFAIIELKEKTPQSSPKRGFVKLLKSKPDVVKYIRKLTYYLGDDGDLIATRYGRSFDDEAFLLSSILPDFLRSIPHLNCLKITVPNKTILYSNDWKEMDSSLTSALLHLMHLPTINRIDLSWIKNFPLSSLITCVNLLRLKIVALSMAHEDDSFEIVQSEVMPKLREFHTSWSSVQTRKLLRAKMQDGRPAFNLMSLRRLSLCAEESEDKSNFPYLLQNAKLLEELRFHSRGSMVGLHNILSPIACTLKVLHLKSTFYFHRSTDVSTHTRRICEDLEAMAGHNIFEALTYEIMVTYTLRGIDDFIGTTVQKIVNVLVKPGWSALRQVSFKVTRGDREELEVLRSLTDICLSHLSKLESVQVAFSCTNRTS